MRARLASLLLCLLALSCKRSAEAPSPAPAPRTAHTNRQVFQVKGVVNAVNTAEKQVIIRHEAVTNYMPAMTMPFDVKDPNELVGLEPGTPVTFRLVVTDTEGWIEQVQKLGLAATNRSPATLSTRLGRDVEPLAIGDPLPDYRFTNELGEVMHTRQFAGQALAITFLFTRCPFPNFCPRMASDFAEVQQKLLALTAAPTNWHLLTLSFDPEFDKPEVLKNYARAWHYEPARWTFATGGLAEVTAFGEQLGLQFWHDETGSLNHNLRTVVVDASGRLQKIIPGNNWTPDELVREIAKAAAVKP